MIMSQSTMTQSYQIGRAHV